MIDNLNIHYIIYCAYLHFQSASSSDVLALRKEIEKLTLKIKELEASLNDALKKVFLPSTLPVITNDVTVSFIPTTLSPIPQIDGDCTVPDDDEECSCEYCGKVFESWDEVDSHTDNFVIYRCSVCKLLFHFENEKAGPEFQITGEDGELIATCEDCVEYIDKQIKVLARNL